MQSLKWWQTAVFYQIYPRSFADGNGDGIGDFVGMIDRLDYLRDLGVGALWLSPHYPSPNADCGYDISDYTNVAAEYGNPRRFPALPGRRARTRDARPARSCSQPHLGRAPVVQGIALPPRQPEARLVYLVRSGARWRSAEQLVFRLWRFRLDVRCNDRAVPFLFHPDKERYLAFLRTTPEQRCPVALNFTAERVTTQFSFSDGARLRTIFSSHARAANEENPAHLTLAPFEAYIGEVLLVQL